MARGRTRLPGRRIEFVSETGHWYKGRAGLDSDVGSLLLGRLCMAA